ncbi:MAG: hypothetical protein BroJett013_30370 [Alphaproteobacteria bacterium]|nr:MAG: hypothetical protein BroJett013_30370 [Alphaproteobacteria bacterium]
MSCISRTPDHPLTGGQIDTLQLLHRAGACSRESAIHVYQPAGRSLNANIVGALIDKGLAHKASRTIKRTRRTIYWLNPAGWAAAKRTAGARAAKRPISKRKEQA